MDAHAVTQRFCGHFFHPFDVHNDCLPPVEHCPRDVDELSLDVWRLYLFRSLCDDGEKLFDLVLIHRLDINVVRCPEGWVRYDPPGDLGCSLCDPLLDSDCREAEDVLPIGFVLRVADVVNLWFNRAVISAGVFGGRSQRREHVNLLDVDCRLVVIERVADVLRQSIHSLHGVFEQLPFEGALNFCDERIRVVVGIAADSFLVKADLQHIHQDSGFCLRVDA